MKAMKSWQDGVALVVGLYALLSPLWTSTSVTTGPRCSEMANASNRSYKPCCVRTLTVVPGRLSAMSASG